MKYKLMTTSMQTLDYEQRFIVKHKFRLGLLATTALLLTGCGRPFVVEEKVRLASKAKDRDDWCAELPPLESGIC